MLISLSLFLSLSFSPTFMFLQLPKFFLLLNNEKKCGAMRVLKGEGRGGEEEEKG